MNKYEKWISNLKNVKLQCKELTEEMQKLFPELTRVRGHYHCPSTGRREHWWLKDLNGNIVDPTASQFPSTGHYEEWDEDSPEPTGRCLQCGDLCYNSNYFCGDLCRKEYAISSSKDPNRSCVVRIKMVNDETNSKNS